jgi:putative transcriptional regulator
LTTSRDILEAIGSGCGPSRILVALGYAGWGQGQLEKEIVENAWLNAPADAPILFDYPATQRWKAAAGTMGLDIGLLGTSAGHA